MSRKPTDRQTAIAVAMFTRDAPLVVTTDGTAFVPRWGSPPIAQATVSGMDARGLIARAARAGRVYVLTEAGRTAARAAIGTRQPEQRERAA
ncbi:hypothetical protein EYW49_08945 [Siculibacillus lacustris]|uniref:MarR family transcriptional regulator n=1 Tax=Siculibacillus lacustris TaxID=1549641 RepID=A0A4Q9VSI0_9HYPH|nr:hypothetical protein [Siculibacillus lacustris]TBW38805.1 hypothetical protein EYW49_08945 [Siculibacillus lacustris]